MYTFNLIYLILNIVAAIVLTYFLIKLYFPKKEKKEMKWTCYEIWRPNIPDDGCKKQCNACKEEQQLRLKD